MKTKPLHIVLTGILFLACPTLSKAQENGCVQCSGSTTSGNHASAIGNGTTASGNHSFAGGYLSTASGSNSFAFGYNSRASQSTATAIGNTAQATGSGSLALGNYVKASAQNAFVLGGGTSASYPLTNSTSNSIAFGVNSNKPTLLITKATNNNYTGKVAIGPLTSPQTKLHIKADNNEDAGLFLEPSNKTSRKAFIQLFDNTHLLSVDKSGILSLNAGTGMVSLSGDHYCFGKTNEKKIRVHTDDHAGLYHNVNRTANGETRDGDGSSYAIEFNKDELLIKTAEEQAPRGSAITNWKNALLVNTNGTIGIGSKTTYLENHNEEQFVIHSPSQLNLQSNQVTLHGKVGINTLNQVDDYALAVNGGIISTKVFIKEVNQWPDHVFADDYPLLSFDELREYIQQHHHLPGIPSEAAVTSAGYDLNEMHYALLEKIEEMTRYILALEEEIDHLKDDRGSKIGTIQFSYDNHGNRVSRNLLFKKEPSPDPPHHAPLNARYDLFPNPTPGQFTLLMHDEPQGARLHAILMTETGTILEEHDLADPQTDFDLSRHANGFYLLEVTGPHGTDTWKVIKR